MAYRIEENVTWRQMWYNLNTFLTELTTIYDISYDSATGDGALNNLSVPANTAVTEIWSFICTATALLDNIVFDGANTGDGTLDDTFVYSGPDAPETWTLTCIDETVPATFSVVGSVTGATADATDGVLYDNGEVKFTINAGTSPWAEDDIISFDVTSAIFSVTGTVSGAQAPATIGVPYNNGIINFTLSEGATPWAFNDIITFTAEATTAPPWTATTIEGEPIRLIKRFYYKNGTVPAITGDYRVSNTKPKHNSTAFVPVRVGMSSTGYAGTHCYTSLGPRYSSRQSPSTRTASTIVFWARSIKPLYTGSWSYGGVTPACTSSSNYYDGYQGLGFNFDGFYAGSDSYSFTHTDSITIPTTFYRDRGIKVDDWCHYGISTSGTGNGAYCHINGEYIGYMSASGQQGINQLLGHQPLADVARFNYNLSTAEILAIYESDDAVNWDGADVSESYRYYEDDVLPWVLVTNTDTSGAEISASFKPQNGPYFSYNLNSNYRGTPMIGDFSERDWEDYESSTRTPTMPNANGTACYMLGGEPNQIVAKYWFIANNDYITIAYKIYDPSTSQQLPVYQLGYIGRTKTSEDMEYKAVIGTYTSNSTYWYTSSTSLRSGVFDASKAYFMSLGAYNTPTTIAYSGAIGGFIDYKNSYNIYPITYYHSTYGRNYGELYGIFGVQVINVDLEDEFIIEGERYIALGDGTRAGTNSLILLRLG